MGRNIIVLADGTGQRGGRLFDERRSNIYKIYRGVRCGPDSSVDPRHQLAYYDAGLGTLPGGIDSPVALVRSFLNLTSQATGLGIVGNIVDCYAALVRMWEPGDRIYLFGFSRGAYTVRCLGGVLALCGLPTQMSDGSPLKRDKRTSRKIAREAVKDVYDFTNSRPASEATERQKELLDQRALLAARFRRRYGSDQNDKSNTVPYFIGVFDTVASLMNPAALLIVAVITTIAFALLSAALSIFIGSFGGWFLGLMAGTAVAVGLWLLSSRVKWAWGLPGHPFRRTFHVNSPRVQMYDKSLNDRVSFARHAISLDETRHSFPRVKWGEPGVWKASDPAWFEQLWFAGNHSDIGGSYPENESRLSDVTLQWMLDTATQVGMLHDPSVLRTYPNPEGPQHDETRGWIFRFARKRQRKPPSDGPLHPSVFQRLQASAVLQYNEMKPYRPDCLRSHKEAGKYYGGEAAQHFAPAGKLSAPEDDQ